MGRIIHYTTFSDFFDFLITLSDRSTFIEFLEGYMEHLDNCRISKDYQILEYTERNQSGEWKDHNIYVDEAIHTDVGEFVARPMTNIVPHLHDIQDIENKIGHISMAINQMEKN